MRKKNKLEAHMKKIELEDIKKITKEILKDFDCVCRTNNIRYSIAYGTLLGAIRHNGFIPWDDDIDVIMPRPDFELFSDIWKEKLNPTHRFISIDNTREFMAPLAKIIDTRTVLKEEGHPSRIKIGVYIDIFVYDGMPSEENLQRKIYKRVNLLQRGWSFGECYNKEKTNLFLRPIRLLCNQTNIARYISIYMNHFAKRYAFESSEYMGNNMFGEYRDRSKYLFKSSEFNDLIDYNFDELVVLGFKEYDKFLSRWYGDYMQLPPKEKQVSNHDFCAWWAY